MSLIYLQQSVLQNEREEIFEMLPRFDVLLLYCTNEAQLDLFGGQHKHHRLLGVGVDALDGEEALQPGVFTGWERAIEELAVDLEFASLFVK